MDRRKVLPSGCVKDLTDNSLGRPKLNLSGASCPFYSSPMFFCCIRHRFCFRSKHEIINGLDLCEILIERFYNDLPDLKLWDRERVKRWKP